MMNSRDVLPRLVPGEVVALKIEGVLDISLPQIYKGILYVTNFQTFFVDNATKNVHAAIPFGFVISIKKLKHQLPSSVSIAHKFQYLEFRCKDFRNVKYILPQSTASEVREHLKQAIFPGQHTSLFAFSYLPRDAASLEDWCVYDCAKDFNRMGFLDPASNWRMTSLNSAFSISPTYPEVLLVPATVTDATLTKVAAFRSKGRIPACVWRHPHNLATISRCSQPLVGLGRSRCEEDEVLFREILRATPTASKIFIVDARPHINASANSLSGGGAENIHNYLNCVLEYMDIGNIHVMRDSCKKLSKVCAVWDDKSNASWNDLGSCHWYDHISAVIAAARRVIQHTDEEGCPVVIHCSDGWDRTAQISGIAQMMMDPYYRTIDGFIVLLCKEWLSFGHKFGTRNGNMADSPASQRAPIFLQFVDAVWQLTRQFPTSFEFNEDFLTLIMDHVNSNLFGTFLFDCESERHLAKTSEQTASLWGLVRSVKKRLQNPLYVRADNIPVLIPNPNVTGMQLWRSFYLRYRYAPYLLPTPDVKDPILRATISLDLGQSGELDRWTVGNQPRPKQTSRPTPDVPTKTKKKSGLFGTFRRSKEAQQKSEQSITRGDDVGDELRHSGDDYDDETNEALPSRLESVKVTTNDGGHIEHPLSQNAPNVSELPLSSDDVVYNRPSSEAPP